VSVRVLAYDGDNVARDHAAGPVFVGRADACSTYVFTNAFVMLADG
jgi:hypothetical protein